MKTKTLQPVVIIACAVFQNVIDKLLPETLLKEIIFLDYGLHLVPGKLNHSLQKTIDCITEPSRIILGYGLCGNGLNGINARQHTLYVPQADDCIAIFLGSYQDYISEFSSNPGTYYLTKGWLESGSTPLAEYQTILKKYDAETAEYIMDQQYKHYKRLVFVAHTPEDLEQYRAKAKEVFEFCSRWDMDYEEILGSDLFLRKLVDSLDGTEKHDREILTIQPGEEIKQSLFIR